MPPRIPPHCRPPPLPTDGRVGLRQRPPVGNAVDHTARQCRIAKLILYLDIHAPPRSTGRARRLTIADRRPAGQPSFARLHITTRGTFLRGFSYTAAVVA